MFHHLRFTSLTCVPQLLHWLFLLLQLQFCKRSLSRDISASIARILKLKEYDLSRFGSTLTLALFCTFLALSAKRSVAIVSSYADAMGVIQARTFDKIGNTKVREFPPKESLSKYVSFESRYGTNVALVDNALMTFPSDDSDWLIADPSLSLFPTAPVESALSEPVIRKVEHTCQINQMDFRPLHPPYIRLPNFRTFYGLVLFNYKCKHRMRP